MKAVLVVPTIRENWILRFLFAWKNELLSNKIPVIIIEDHPKKEINLSPNSLSNLNIVHYCWTDIKDELGKDEWIISRRNAGIRSFGFLKALDFKPSMVITLDDDCFPDQKNFFLKHWQYLNTPGTLGWVATSHEPTRGFPYKIRGKAKVVINHGLWSGIPDYDAKTFLTRKQIVKYPVYSKNSSIIPLNNFFSMCSMNLSFRPEIIPAMYFLLMGKNAEGKSWGYDRFDDVWAGIIIKKICDHLRLAIRSGSPSVEHKKASDPQSLLTKEKRGLKTNEWFWKKINDIELRRKTIADCYLEVADEISSWRFSYFRKLSEAMKIWIYHYKKRVRK